MVTILIGTEPYLIAKEKASIIASHDSMNTREYTSLDEKVLSDYSTLPFLADKKLIILSVDKLQMLGTEQFIDVAMGNEFSDTLILPGAVDKRTKFYNHLLKSGCVKVCDKLTKQAELDKAIDEMVRELGGDMLKAPKSLFERKMCYLENDDVNLFDVYNELITLVHFDKNITEESVELLVRDRRKENVFILTKSIVAGNVNNIQTQAHLIADSKESSSIGALSCVLRDFRLSYKAAVLKTSDNTMLGGYPTTALVQRGVDRLLGDIKLLLDGIDELKSSDADEEAVLVRVMLSLL